MKIVFIGRAQKDSQLEHPNHNFEHNVNQCL